MAGQILAALAGGGLVIVGFVLGVVAVRILDRED